jgi:hypothetical protein
MNHTGEKFEITDKEGYYDALTKFRACRSRALLKRCMYWGQVCSNPIGSHSISRSWLEQISEKGHVNSLEIKVDRAPHEAVRIVVNFVGVNKASVFPGFCEEHDGKLFAPIERQQFTGTDEQLHLLAYRSICREACVKHQVVGFQLEQGMVEAAPTPHGIQTMNEVYRTIELLALKQEFEETIKMNDFTLLEHCVIKFGKVPPMLVSTIFIPLVTATGRRLEVRQQERIILNVLPTSNGGFAILSWMKSAPKNGSLFAKSLHGLTSARLTDTLLKLIVEVSDNFFFAPTWWCKLDANQNRIMKAFARNITMGDDMPPPNLLSSSGPSMDDWKVHEVRFSK